MLTKTDVLLIIALTIFFQMSMAINRHGCLTGPDIDARIQRHLTEETYQPPTTTEKEIENGE